MQEIEHINRGLYGSLHNFSWPRLLDKIIKNHTAYSHFKELSSRVKTARNDHLVASS
jgi:hypothetical protein